MDGNTFSKKASDNAKKWMKMENPRYKDLIQGLPMQKRNEYKNKSGEELNKRALALIAKIENGEVKEDEEIYEIVDEITLLFGAIEDAYRDLIRERINIGGDKKTISKEKAEKWREGLRTIKEEFTQDEIIKILRGKDNKKRKKLLKLLSLVFSIGIEMQKVESKQKEEYKPIGRPRGGNGIDEGR